LPKGLVHLLGNLAAEPRFQEVAVRPSIAGDRRPSIGLAPPAPAADALRLDAGEPLVAEALERP
jgi:hypothetical protein